MDKSIFDFDGRPDDWYAVTGRWADGWQSGRLKRRQPYMR